MCADGPVQALILAGGRGTRLRPLTDLVPKPLVPVAGRPFLCHQLEWLRANGVEEAVLLVGYLAEQFHAQLGDGRRFGLRLRYSHEVQPLGTAGAIRNAAGMLAREFYLVNGDTLLQVPLESLRAAHLAASAIGTLVVSPGSGGVAGNVRIAADGRVASYDKRRSDGAAHVDAGVALYSREVLEFIPAAGACGLEQDVFPALIRAGRLAAMTTLMPFYDMGTQAGLARLEQVLQ